MQLVVDKIRSDKTFNGTGMVDKNTLTMIGQTGNVDVKLTFTANDQDDIENIIPLTGGLKRNLILENVDRTLDEFDLAHAQSEAVKEANAHREAYDARLTVAQDTDALRG